MKSDEKVFGSPKKYHVWSDNDLAEGDIITIVNKDCKEEFDCVTGEFCENLLYCYISDISILDTDYSSYNPKNSIDGGEYAFATATVLKIHEKTY